MSTGISLGITDASRCFIALTTRHVRRGKANLWSDDFMAWRIYSMWAVLIIVFAFAHVVGLQKLDAMRSERPATIDLLAD